ncbi:MAG: hypothetical protein GX173_09955 [Ruminococcaceae bacterium]|nr:hypothetical protein [Oscillospiraceae bacterium]
MKQDAFDYRVLWTWDYCTFWDDSNFIRGFGATGENKRRRSFLDDYKRMVDFCAVHGINGIVIWGALRAHNDGEQQLKDLVRYGRMKGVRILPGVGLFSYGGVYYDARKNNIGMTAPPEYHPYSLHSWLKEHPELSAIAADKKPYATGFLSDLACPSRIENIEWFKRALAWLFQEIDVDGVQMEVGDYAVCHCDLCEKKRKGHENSVFCIEDMIEPYTIACDVIKSIKPDAWAICETYSSFASPHQDNKREGFGAAIDEKQKSLLRALPQETIVQWVMDRAVGLAPLQKWDEYSSTPFKNNISRIHAGSQHTLHGPDEWAIHSIGDMVQKSRQSAINGISIFGEESPASPPSEANYLIFSEFSGYGNPNPNCSMNTFYAQTLDPLYGGSGMSREWERIYISGHIARLNKQLQTKTAKDPRHFHPLHLAIDQPDLVDIVCSMSSQERQKYTLKLIAETHDISSKLSGESCRRWSWLENWLWRAEYLHRTIIT